MVANTLAGKVIRTCLRIGENDKVAIFTWRHMLDLAEAFRMECKRLGAHASIEYESDDMWYDTVKNLPLYYLETPDPFDLALGGVATAAIFISGPENPERQVNVSAKRWMALARADSPFYEMIIKRKVRIAKIRKKNHTQISGFKIG